jgi:hypothetical protein
MRKPEWSRLIRYAAAYLPDSEPLAQIHPPEGRHQCVRGSVRSVAGARLKGLAPRASRKRLLRPFSVRRHQPEIVFSVLVVVLGPDDIPGPRFFLGKREISLVASLGVSMLVRLGSGGTRYPPLWARSK